MAVVATTMSTSAALEAFFAMLGKTDGRDKMLATLQYASMFVGGMDKNSQATVLFKALGGARKPFRFVKPFETLYPLVKGVTGAKGPTHMRALAKAKALGMALYFAGDHLVWAYNTGLLKNKKNQEMVQKASWYGWLIGSITSVIMELSHISKALKELKEKNDDKADVEAKKAALQKRYVTLAHGSTQMLLCLGLLQVVPFKPRVTGTFGVITSALSCYMLLPPIKKEKDA